MSDRYNALMGTGAAADPRELDALASGTCANPFHVLGRHATVEAGLPALVVRTIQPRASSVELVANGRRVLFSPTFRIVDRLLRAKRDLEIARETTPIFTQAKA
jgi:hypothetical protein